MGLPLLFVTVSVVELGLLVAVENRVGLGTTLLLIFVTGVLGAFLVRAQGLGVLGSARRRLQEGFFPGREIAHGAMVVGAGILLLTPGFLTDAIGLALMVPSIREQVRRWGTSRVERRIRR